MFGDGQGSRYSWRAGRCRHFWWGRRWIGHIARADAAAAQAHRLVSHLVNAWRERRVKPEKRTHAKASMRTRARETGRRTDGFRERRERERERVHICEWGCNTNHAREFSRSVVRCRTLQNVAKSAASAQTSLSGNHDSAQCGLAEVCCLRYPSAALSPERRE